MGKQRITDVKLNVTGLGGNLIPIGVSITYAPGAIPVATVNFVPGSPGDPYVKGTADILDSVDSKKRTNDVTINVSVDTWVSSVGDKVNKSLKFIGFLDGMNISNAVGNNSYQAIIKNKAQTALELTTQTPGLYPSSINIYKNPSFANDIDANKDDDQAVLCWSMLLRQQQTADFNPNLPPVKYYTGLMKTLIKLQLGGWKPMAGYERSMTGDINFTDIFEAANYKKALTTAQTFFNNIDLSAVEGGSMGICSRLEVSQALEQAFTRGPNTLLDNYLNFLQEINCTLIISNTKMFVVPYNSFLKQPHGNIGEGEIQYKPNRAGPADYDSYVYNDNGYKDIAYVIILGAGVFGGGTNTGENIHDRFVTATHKAPKSNASGVLAVKAHPWMMASASQTQGKDAIDLKRAIENGSISPFVTPFEASLNAIQKPTAARQKEKKTNLESTMKEIMDNYAETKFYQARFTDRTGMLHMNFNPDWVPGTGGTFFVRETGMWIDFYVTNVTHNISTSAPNQGDATTTVNFCCGRMGKDPEGVTSDKFLGYDQGKENSVRQNFLSDIK